MPLSRFYFLDDDGEVHDIRAIEALADAIAIERADQLLAAKSDHVAIEIWRAQGFVKGVRQDGRRYDRSPIHIDPPKHR
jgi:hypothetical protein